MKKAYRMYQRKNGYFYVQNNTTGEQRSLETKQKSEAQRLFHAQLEANVSPELNWELGKVYLSGADPEMHKRTWETAIDELCSHGKPQSQERCRRALNGKEFDLIRKMPIALTKPQDLEFVLKRGGNATNNYLRRLHNLALANGWIRWQIINAKKWRKPNEIPKRAISIEEHSRIQDAEKNEERKNYYEMLWLTGAAQTDGASLSIDNLVEGKQTILRYQRRKTGEWCWLEVGKQLLTLIEKLPKNGPFFPKIGAMASNQRAAEFRRRCRLLKIANVSLHSYRYAWAERAYSAGYPERYAQAALGHQSRAVHHGYAKNAKVICPPLEDTPRIVPFPNPGPAQMEMQ